MVRVARGSTFALASSFALTLVLALFTPDAIARQADVIDRQTYVLRFSAGTGSQVRRLALESAGAEVTGEIETLRLAEVRMQASQLGILEVDPVIEWVHPEGSTEIAGAPRPPNDPLLDRQWPLRKIGVLRGWRTEDGTGAEVIVAVVDTGVDPSHPDLTANLVPGFDFVSDDDDPADDFGHGTHVAGVIAATPNNRKGIAGLSWGAKVMPLKACGVTGACDNFPVVAAIAFAVQNGAKVVNLSLAGAEAGCPPEFDLVARFASARGVLLVAAAGNSAQEENPVMYPASCVGFVGVGATSSADEWAPFSEHNEWVDLSAPGMSILSTIPPGLRGMVDDVATPGYGPADGTSMAAPHVAGLAALLFSQHPDWTPLQVEERMESTAVDLGKPGRDPFFGVGRIDVAAALGGR